MSGELITLLGRIPDLMPSDFLPTASLAALRMRAALLRSVREFFDRHGFWEVDTPLLSADIVVDAWLDPFVTAWNPDAAGWRAASHPPCFLQTSPEFAMKRLLAAGAEAIYQLGKVFRNGESGRRHNPEFTMIEWYRRGDDHAAQMETTEALVRAMLQAASRWQHDQKLPLSPRATAILTGPAFAKIAYEDAFRSVTQVAVLSASMNQLHELARQRGMIPPPGLAEADRDGWLNWLLAELVEPQLGIDRPVFLCDFPASQAALARTHQRGDGIEVAHRFELYIDGVEYCNGYHELTDPGRLRQRFAEQARLRAEAGHRPLPVESRLLAAMEAGLPESAGVAMGFDRLMMLATGAETIDAVIPFPFSRA